MMPNVMLKKLIMGKNATELPTQDETIKDSLRFMAERLDQLSQSELASRLTLNCINSYVIPQALQELNITIIDVSNL
jgi:maspardin